MPEATNAQMQSYADQRIRIRAEQFRDLLNAVNDDKASIDDEYQRATGTNRWNDARLDGPPHLLQAGNSANPDDFTNYNSFITLFQKFMNGTFANVSEANSAAAEWGVLSRACVRSTSQT